MHDRLEVFDLVGSGGRIREYPQEEGALSRGMKWQRGPDRTDSDLRPPPLRSLNLGFQLHCGRLGSWVVPSFRFAKGWDESR